MTSGLAGVALAAGAGSRLAPITDTVPKALCPVATVPLVDLALERLRSVGADPAVNVHHHADTIAAAVAGRAHVSHERERALGTAGAVGRLRGWIDGRPVVVVNADTWCPGGLDGLLDGWDGRRVRVLVPGGEGFGPDSAVVGTLLPWAVVDGLDDRPSGLYEVVWRQCQQAGALEVVPHRGPWADCGTPARLLEANLSAIGSGSVIAPGARVRGRVTRSCVSAPARVDGDVTESVILPGGEVEPGQHLRRSIRWIDRHGRQQTLQP